MMEFNPTSDQRHILNIKNKNIIISASAGSGKTTIMVEKIFNILKEEKISVNDILVVTFTKSAALEMKQRLAKKLNENADSQIVQDQLDDLTIADICTVDSFCEKIVKKYFYVLGIDESFSVISTQEKADLMSSALQSAISLFKIQNIDEYKLLIDIFSNNRTEKQLKMLVLKVADFMSSLKDETLFLKKSNELYTENSFAITYLTTYIDTTLKHYKDLMTKYQKDCKAFGLLKYVEAINAYVSYLDSIILPKTLEKKLMAIENKIIVTIRTEKNDDNNYKEKIIATKTACQKFISKILEKMGNSEILANSFESCKKIHTAFVNLLLLFKQKYSELKLKHNLLDFSDLEKFTLEILQNHEILAEIKSTYKKIFVDEFQDVNEIQFAIFDTIKNLNNAFYVGDFKQAIYGFRQSNPQLFLDTVQNFENDVNSCSANLKSNFRSDPLILNFVNTIFNSIMTTTTSNVDYKIANLDGDKNYQQSDIPAIQINIVDDVKTSDGVKNGVYSVMEDYLSDKNNQNIKQKESNRIAEIITEIIGKNIYDNKLKIYRPIDYSDIVILLRKRGDYQSILVKTLTSCNIPCIANLKELLDDTYDVKILYSALKATLTIDDDYLTCGLLLSPLFNFDENELAKIKLMAPAKTFCESLAIYKNNNNDDISEKLNSYFITIQNLDFDIRYKGIYEALWNLCYSHDYFFNIANSDDFVLRQQNITNYIESFSGSIYEFDLNKYINMRENALSDANISNVTSQNSRVTITTMHQSKGLEYPIVILANMGEDFSKEPDNSEIKLNSNIGIGIKTYVNNTKTKYFGPFYTCVDLKNRDEILGEKLRLLYVATTRAKNSLYIVGNDKNFNFSKNNDFNVLNASNYLSMIVGALSEEEIAKINNKQSFNIGGNCKYEFKYIDYDIVNKKNNNIFLLNEQLSPEQKNLKTSAINYINISLNNPKHKLALKNSVSKLSFDETNASINFAPQNLHLTEDLNDYYTTEQGTSIHKILETIDFLAIKTKEDIFNQLSKNNLDSVDIKELNYSFDDLLKIILKIKAYIQKQDIVLKEQKFVSYLSACEITDADFNDKLLVQGAVDLMIVKPDEIYMFDYKLSALKKENLLKKYKKQLSLYALAINKAYKKPVRQFLVSLKYGEIYEIT